jgi:hypothetical protein
MVSTKHLGSILTSYETASMPSLLQGQGKAWLFHPESWSVLPSSVADRLDPELLSRWSRVESRHFFMIGIQGETYLGEFLRRMESDSETFRKFGVEQAIAKLISEENHHTDLFQRYLTLLDLPLTPLKFDFGRNSGLTAEPDLALFFGQNFIIEFVATQLSADAARDERLHPDAREVHRFHWLDERHHIRFSLEFFRALTSDLESGHKERILKSLSSWSELLKRAFLPEMQDEVQSDVLDEMARAAGETRESLKSLIYLKSRSHPVWNRSFAAAMAQLIGRG